MSAPAPITADLMMTDINTINAINVTFENSYEFSKESKRKHLAEISLSVDRDMSTRPQLPQSYLVINMIHDNLSHHEGLFTTNEAATAYITRLAVNLSLELYPDDVEDCNGVMNEESFYDFVVDIINKNYKKIILTHLDVLKPVYCVIDEDNDYIGNPTEYLTNSLTTWKSSQVHGRFMTDSDYLEECMVKINPEVPDLATSTYY
jgi:hypothetical protein